MSAIIKNFKIKISERQANEIRKQFKKACDAAGEHRAAMLIQPKTQWCGLGSIGLLPPVLDVAVVSIEVFDAVTAVIASHRIKAGKPMP
jgi:hypothetical protein